ncbi:MAG: hypothetical protein GY944_29525 [bacterium]|nr:hypothetical protein [bacterium]
MTEQVFAHPLRRVLLTLLQGRSPHGIIQSALSVKRWCEELPSAASVRPACCPRCRAPSQIPGEPLRLYGHGKVERQQWGPSSVDGAPQIVVVILRRYQCQVCAAVVRVGPRGLVEHHRYAAAAIAMALCLWLVEGWEQARVRERVGLHYRRSKEADAERRWRSLGRWNRRAREGRLWPELARHRSVKAMLRALAALGPQHGLGAPISALAFSGAAHRQGGPSMV